MASTYQAQIPLKQLSRQAKNAGTFPNLHSSLISIGQVCDDECIVTFDKHKVIVSKTSISSLKAIGTQQMDYGDSLFIIHFQNNKQAKILEPHLCNHIRPMAPRHPRAYKSKYHQDLTIFFHHILCCPTKRTLLQAIKDGSFSTWP